MTLGRALLWLGLVWLGGGCGPGRRDPGTTLVVFAAASLTDAVNAVAGDFEAATGVAVQLSLAGSSLLARQIAEGAPADVFLSAHPDWIAYVIERGRARPEDRIVFARNRLVVVVPRGRPVPARLEDLAGLGRIALADPASVPAGVYARAMLAKAGLWAAIERRVVPAFDVRAALKMAEAGAVDAAVVYRTDAACSPGVVAAEIVPAALQPAIRYVGVITAREAGGERAAAARAFLDRLAGPAGAARLAASGFAPGPGGRP